MTNKTSPAEILLCKHILDLSTTDYKRSLLNFLHTLYYNRSLCCELLGRLKKSKLYAKLSIQYAPNYWKGYYRLSNLYALQDKQIELANTLLKLFESVICQHLHLSHFDNEHLDFTTFVEGPLGSSGPKDGSSGPLGSTSGPKDGSKETGGLDALDLFYFNEDIQNKILKMMSQCHYYCHYQIQSSGLHYQSELLLSNNELIKIIDPNGAGHFTSIKGALDYIQNEQKYEKFTFLLAPGIHWINKKISLYLRNFFIIKVNITIMLEILNL